MLYHTMYLTSCLFCVCVCFSDLVKTQTDFQSNDSLVFVNEGDSVNITCHYQSEMAMHFSWYKHKLGQKPKLISNFYKYDQKATFHHEFKGNARFNMVNKKGVTHLEIKEIQLSDSATYYCGSAHSNIVEFGEGTQLLVQALQMHSFSVIQRPVLELSNPGASVTLHCTVTANRCAGKQSVYWFRHNSGESQPGFIYTHEDSNDFCKKKGTGANSPTQTCVYSLPKMNLSPSDAGTYYCAVAACGEILFGNGTKLDINKTDQSCSEHIHTLVLFSIIRSSVLVCCSVVIMIYIYRAKKAASSYRKTWKKKTYLPK
ncbi:immunoglobulin kappa light chain-like isoform X2 [Hemibagrus wyckioides]|uniref:immunoglobulin kappa light chain-like isoform X2 n=2 Tax=Hemibagrus wyckioides TaxID=337641 RepID=UPI00266BC708|nr:immunoglobulin kappa light chain-like isoform X2 [Hemibagrus wyckioides]